MGVKKVEKEILGYLIGAINNHNRTVKLMKEARNPSGLGTVYESFVEELKDLKEFIENESEELVAESRTTEWFRNRVRELEESCENMCEVHKNQQNQIEVLKIDLESSKGNAKTWSKRYVQGLETNINLVAEIEEQKGISKECQLACNKLKEENESLREKLKLHEETRKTRQCIRGNEIDE